MQVGFGEKWLPDTKGGRVKVRFAAFALSHSCYKHVELQSRPYTSADLTGACRCCFQYIDGIPQELVFDQDSIVTVSENYGDVIHTYEFEKLRQDMKLSVYLCRAADPESKGKIDRLFEATDALFEHRAHGLLLRLRTDKSRYARDQLGLIETLCAKYGGDCTLEAILACEKLELFGATYVKDYLRTACALPAAEGPSVIAGGDPEIPCHCRKTLH